MAEVTDELVARLEAASVVLREARGWIENADHRPGCSINRPDHSGRCVCDCDRDAILAALSPQGLGASADGWQPIETAPKDGTPFYARHQSPYRFQPYKPTSEQYRCGRRGRWQVMNEYGGWENCPEPVGDWKPHPDFARAPTAGGRGRE